MIVNRKGLTKFWQGLLMLVTLGMFYLYLLGLMIPIYFG